MNSGVKPLRIGNLVIDFPVALAPMAGFTDTAMRTLCLEQGCGLVVTEMVNARGLVHNSKRTCHILETSPGEHPVGAHLYGCEPSVLADAAGQVEQMKRFAFIDINCGCPVRRIMSKGNGAALMADPEKIGRIVSAITHAVSIPVTVKTRLGIDPSRQNAREVAQAVQDNGGAALFLHARLASQKHGGRADWDALAVIKNSTRIPVIGNGGISRAADVPEMLKQTGVDGVMIGRGAIGNPWIFSEVRALLEGRPRPSLKPEDYLNMIREHLVRVTALKEHERLTTRRRRYTADQAATFLFRAQLARYMAPFGAGAEIRRSLNGLESVGQILDLVTSVIASRGRKLTE